MRLFRLCLALCGATLLLMPPARPQAQTVSVTAVDPLLANQWHLKPRNLEVAGADVVDEWPLTTGAGVVIGVVDDGLQWTHPDLQPNYLGSASFDFNGNDTDPSPSTAGACSTTADCHGTAAAGVAAAKGDNGIGVSGAAPGASLAGLRLIAAATSDQQEASALNYLPQAIHIASNSWGPSDDGVTLSGPGPLTYAAMQSAVTAGRGGKGRVFVWAAGNGRANNDNCNFDGYANSRFVIAVGALADTGQQASYSESCAALMVSAPSNGGVRGITTTDLTGASGYDASDYTSTFGGTSSATPLVSGAVALMLARNPALTWRDVQYVLRQSSFRLNPADAGWTVGPFPHNEKFGFGQLDAKAAADLAATWTNVPVEATPLTPAARVVNAAVPDNNATGVSDGISIGPAEADFVVEHVEVDFTATHPWRGDLHVTLTSPAGVVSLLAPRRSGDSNDNFSGWRLTSVRHWAETATGTWTLRVADLAAQDIGTWNSWSLRIYGYRSSTIPGTPTALAATPGNGQVLLNWTAPLSTGGNPITGYRVQRATSAGGPFADAAGCPTAVTATTCTATGLTNGTAYFFRVATITAAAQGAYTAVVGPVTPLAGSVPFTDPVLVPGVTVVKAIHVTELRTRINALRAHFGLPASTWTDAALPGVVIKRVHVTEMRAALAAAYTAAGLTQPTFTDAVPTTVRAVHVSELRSAVTVLEAVP